MSFTQNMIAISVELVPLKRLGSWVGIQGFCGEVVGIVLPIICGYLWAFVFPGSVFYFLVATQIVAFVMLVLVPTEITR
jgi:sugar phosphate permease